MLRPDCSPPEAVWRFTFTRRVVGNAAGNSSITWMPDACWKSAGPAWPIWLAVAAVAIVIVGILVLWRFVSPISRLSPSEREAMVERVRAALREAEGDRVAA